jgi:hypothetical protein
LQHSARTSNPVKNHFEVSSLLIGEMIATDLVIPEAAIFQATANFVGRQSTLVTILHPFAFRLISEASYQEA